MFYLLYQQLSSEWRDAIPGFNLLQYQTVRTGLSLFTALIVAVAMGSRFIRWVQKKQGKGQPIRDDGPEGHFGKRGTPTMGGFMILAGVVAATLLWADLGNVYVLVTLMVTVCFGALGFMDDYSKVTKQHHAGLSGKQKLAAQFIVATAAVALLIMFSTEPPDVPELNTSVAFPMTRQFLLDLGWFYLAFGAITIAGFSNAVNLTDGLDGLAIVPVMFCAAAFGVIAYLVGRFDYSQYLGVHFVPAAGELAVFCAALIGGGMGFLWYNAPPAKIFMGDTGSLALGGALGTMAVSTKHEIVLGIIGGLFVAEALSVIVQVASFKLTGKRVFRMAPIHHHYEKAGWAESTVVIRFWIISAGLALVGLATLKLR
ncbi:MAG TPA: phospho-N-acetylmuramoyl-pentapeptide-transferase [Caulobacteraceae bacterium]